MKWINLLEGLIGGGMLLKLLTMRSSVKKAHAESNAVEISNTKELIAEWQKLVDENKTSRDKALESLKELRQQLERQTEENSKLRDEINTLQQTISSLKIKIASDKVRLCKRRNCELRTPPSGY